jgi:hypothetical protein
LDVGNVMTFHVFRQQEKEGKRPKSL